jgi:hypothetical protein
MEEEDLINISTFCNFISIKFGQKISSVGTMLNQEDESLTFWINYTDSENRVKNFIYNILSHNFIMTDKEFLVNKDTIDTIKYEIEKRLMYVHKTFKAD